MHVRKQEPIDHRRDNAQTQEAKKERPGCGEEAVRADAVAPRVAVEDSAADEQPSHHVDGER